MRCCDNEDDDDGDFEQCHFEGDKNVKIKQEQLNYGMDSMSLDSGEDSKADDMDEMTMPNPGSIQVNSNSNSFMVSTHQIRVNMVTMPAVNNQRLICHCGCPRDRQNPKEK